MYLNPLADDCWILTVANLRDEAVLVTADEVDFDFVPTEQDRAYENYDMFWDTELTILFRSYDEAIDYLSNYEGPLNGPLDELYNKQIKL